jgi:hypothetical protein
VNVQRKLSQLYSPRLVSFDYLRISLISTTWWTLNTLWKIILGLFDTGPTSWTQYRTTKLTPVFSLDHHHIPSPPSPLLTHRPSLPLSFPYRLVSIRYSPGQYSSSFLTPPSFGPVVLSSVPICASSGLLMCLRMVRCTLKRTKLEEICFCSCLGRAGNGGRGSLARNEMMWTSVGLGINY